MDLDDGKHETEGVRDMIRKMYGAIIFKYNTFLNRNQQDKPKKCTTIDITELYSQISSYNTSLTSPFYCLFFPSHFFFSIARGHPGTGGVRAWRAQKDKSLPVASPKNLCCHNQKKQKRQQQIQHIVHDNSYYLYELNQK